MTYKTFFALGAVILALALIARWDAYKGDAERHSRPLLPLSKDDIVQVELRSPGSPPLIVRYDHQKALWHITAPQAAAADQRKINSLLTTVTDYHYERVISTSKQAWAEYGLSPPAYELTFTLASAPPMTLYIGAEAAVGPGLYTANSSSDSVYFGSHVLALAVRQDFADLQRP